ncbi:MAG TPA: hypothetical protein PLZ67_09070 [Bacteroidales bacterium]|nr:hypothetical protein [Bacteroidales bacterium]HPF00637.1 hypothetical protein [Bacteroidales bacterium]
MSDIKELKRVYLDKKTRISAVGQKIPVVAFLLMWAVLLGLMVYMCITSYYLVFLIMGLIFALCGYLTFRSLRIMRKVYADDQFMYIRCKDVEEKVPFEQIYAGSKPAIRLVSALEAVKFYYKTENGTKKVVKFVPAQVNQMYNQFIDAIAAKNINVKIKRSFL